VTNEATSLQQQPPENDSKTAVEVGDAISTEVQSEVQSEGKPLSPSQSEMPFALVQGKELNIVPKDLYIPPDALEVFLEAFEGPLDLLLYLIRRQNLDILEINVAEITRQYMGYIGLMESIQLGVGGGIFGHGGDARRNQIAHVAASSGNGRRQ